LEIEILQSATHRRWENASHLLSDIISEIQEETENFSWFVSSERIIEILEMRKEDYYRTLYGLRNSEFNPASLRGFSEEEGKYLCLLLKKLLGHDGVELEFVKAGIFLDERSLEDAVSTFKNVLVSSLEKHKLDKELLLLLSSATKSFDDAFDSYFEDKFDMDILVERTVNVFINLHSIDPFYGSDYYLKKYLKEKILTKKINIGEFTQEYKERYHYELFGRTRKSKSRVRISHEMHVLLEFFGLDHRVDRKALKAKYTELLKKYHPDINKSGLEKTKKIIHNYKKLSAMLDE
jgi:hypothetical protein